MKTYMLTAAGVIFLAVLISFIIPEGKLKKSVSFILRLACIFVLVQPVGKIFNFKTSDSVNAEYDYEYFCAVYSQNQSNLLTKNVNEKFGQELVCIVEICYDGTQIKESGVVVQGKLEKSVTIEDITEYLRELGYINISVNEQSG